MTPLYIQWRHIRYPAIVLISFFALLHFCHTPNEKRKNALSPSNSGEGKMTAEGGLFYFSENIKTQKDIANSKIRDVDRVVASEKRPLNYAAAHSPMGVGQL
jgi:hypothetical protein